MDESKVPSKFSKALHDVFGVALELLLLAVVLAVVFIGVPPAWGVVLNMGAAAQSLFAASGHVLLVVLGIAGLAKYLLSRQV